MNALWQSLKLIISYRDEKGKLGKKWFRSKTLWVNFLVIVGLILNKSFGIELDAEITAGILAGVNGILRLITKETTGFIGK